MTPMIMSLASSSRLLIKATRAHQVVAGGTPERFTLEGHGDRLRI